MSSSASDAVGSPLSRAFALIKRSARRRMAVPFAFNGTLRSCLRLSLSRAILSGFFPVKPEDRIGKHSTAPNGRQLIGVSDENETPHLSPVDRPNQAGHHTKVEHRSFIHDDRATATSVFPPSRCKGQVIVEPSTSREEGMYRRRRYSFDFAFMHFGADAIRGFAGRCQNSDRCTITLGLAYGTDNRAILLLSCPFPQPPVIICERSSERSPRKPVPVQPTARSYSSGAFLE